MTEYNNNPYKIPITPPEVMSMTSLTNITNKTQHPHTRLQEYYVYNKVPHILCVIGSSLDILCLLLFIAEDIYYFYTFPSPSYTRYIALGLEAVFVVNSVIMLITSLASTSTLLLKLYWYLIIVYGVALLGILVGTGFDVYDYFITTNEEARTVLLYNLGLNLLIFSCFALSLFSFLFLFTKHGDVRYIRVPPLHQKYKHEDYRPRQLIYVI